MYTDFFMKDWEMYWFQALRTSLSYHKPITKLNGQIFQWSQTKKNKYIIKMFQKSHQMNKTTTNSNNLKIPRNSEPSDFQNCQSILSSLPDHNLLEGETTLYVLYYPPPQPLRIFWLNGICKKNKWAINFRVVKYFIRG